jgi:hypothetical protein
LARIRRVWIVIVGKKQNSLVAILVWAVRRYDKLRIYKNADDTVQIAAQS